MADVASTLAQWSTTTGGNNPGDSTSVGAGPGDNLRTIQSVIRSYLAHYNSSAIASGATTDLGANTGLFQEISGTTTITGLGTVSAGIWKVVRFQGALTLTHNATSLILPGGANITTAAGDIMLAYSKGSGNWVVPFYQRASGRAPSGTFQDSVFRIVDNGDTTKQLAFEASGITTATTRTIYIPDANIPLEYDVFKSANETVNSSATYQNDDHLLFPIASSEVWFGKAFIFANSTSNAGFKATVTVPTGCILGAMGAIYYSPNSYSAASISSSGTTIVGSTAAFNGNLFLEIDIFAENSTTAGNVQIQWAQNTSHADTTTVYRGSRMQARKIA